MSSYTTKRFPNKSNAFQDFKLALVRSYAHTGIRWLALAWHRF